MALRVLSALMAASATAVAVAAICALSLLISGVSSASISSSSADDAVVRSIPDPLWEPASDADREREWEGRLKFLIDPGHKLLYCFIQKNGCTTGVSMFFGATGRRFSGDVWASFYSPGKLHPSDAPFSYKFPTSEVTAAFRDPEYARIIYVRDPAERLLSGYLDKCLSSQRAMHCIGFKRGGKPPSFEKFVMGIDSEMVKNNMHFHLQTGMCDIYNYSWAYTHFLDLSSPDFQEQARELYLSHGVPAAEVDKYYPAAGAKSGGHNHAAHEKMTKYYGNASHTNPLLLKVRELFAQDYKFLLNHPSVHAERDWFYVPRGFT